MAFTRYSVLLAAVLLAFVAGSTKTADAGELVMFREAGCGWCEAWDRDVGAVYPKTAEGLVWPLRMVDMHAKRPSDLTFIKPVVFSPTFVLIEDGAEIGRISGYPGESFFWELLKEIIEKHSSSSGAAATKAMNANIPLPLSR